jgi:hypothetical protein
MGASRFSNINLRSILSLAFFIQLVPHQEVQYLWCSEPFHDDVSLTLLSVSLHALEEVKEAAIADGTTFQDFA